MNLSRLSAPATLTAILGLAAAAGAQTTHDSTVTFALAWQESDADGAPIANPDGILEPGEHALVRLTVSFSNQFTIGSFSPPFGTFSTGTIRAFAGGIIDLNGAAADARGTWNVDPRVGLGTNPTWDLVGPGGWGTPANGGASLINIQAGQFQQFDNLTNPIADIWKGVWTPESFNPRAVTFQSAPGTLGGGIASAVLIRYRPLWWADIEVYCPSNFGSVNIPIAPAPAGVFALAPLILSRRRRPSPTGATP